MMHWYIYYKEGFHNILQNEEAILLDLLSGAALPEDPEGGVTSTSWAPVEGFDTIITVDDVDVSLLAIAREELAVVANHLMRRMFGQQARGRM